MAKIPHPNDPQAEPGIEPQQSVSNEGSRSRQVAEHAKRVARKFHNMRTHSDDGRNGRLRLWIMTAGHPISTVEGKNEDETTTPGSEGGSST